MRAVRSLLGIFSIKRKTGVLTVGVPPRLREGHLYIGENPAPAS
ncbi:hypothetical protein HMPREF3213_01508 [Heyndrickxia coagulans]|uniref:Uncharacterized protein n=1 Tax=Heyndrickxia coagulans TaxID=1398 RepID=A0A133KTV5_HEYCO|nr:hypothetical protein HMPREF3213_01508 [Heyndrickxia coagulans]KYC66800.1 hypothetical protein B4100_0484 [Heyndrickxia coagulans]